MWVYTSPVHPNPAFLPTVTKELLSLMVSLTAFHWFFTIFCPPNLVAFIVLKVTKQVTSAHIVQKLQTPAFRFMFRVSLPVFLYLQLLTPHYWSNSRTEWQFILIDKDGIIFGNFLDYGNKGGEAISVNNWHTYCRQPQRILLFPSTPATCFGRTGHLQALNTWYLKLKIKCILIYF